MKTFSGFKKDIKLAFLSSIPVMTGYLVLGIGFGVVFRAQGYGLIWAFLTSFLIYAGSMQFVLVNLLTSGASLLTTALTTLAVNARHLFYSLSMIDKYRGSGWKKPYLIFALTDETYSLVCSDTNTDKADKPLRYCFLVSLFDQCYWVTGSVLGALLGAVIPFSTEGIDFALTALFITVFVDQWRATKDHLPALIGLGASVLCLVIFGAEDFLIPAMIVIALALTLMHKKGGAKHE